MSQKHRHPLNPRFTRPDLGPDEKALTPEEIALEDAENNPAPLDPRETDNSDGHLEDDDWHAKHPDQGA